jgi:hypothetical protein
MSCNKDSLIPRRRYELLGCVWFKIEEGRGGILMRGREGEGRRNLLINYMFGSKEERGGEGMNFNCKCVWFTRGGEGRQN